jgi:hypothetical protein
MPSKRYYYKIKRFVSSAIFLWNIPRSNPFLGTWGWLIFRLFQVEAMMLPVLSTT